MMTMSNPQPPVGVLTLHISPPGLAYATSGQLVFDPHKPYSGCRICGRVFQSKFDRMVGQPNTKLAIEQHALALRTNWRLTHAKQHPERLHEQLRKSGHWCTPEAAYLMAAYGIIDLIGLGLGGEIASAYGESSAMPTDDVEGT